MQEFNCGARLLLLLFNLMIWMISKHCLSSWFPFFHCSTVAISSNKNDERSFQLLDFAADIVVTEWLSYIPKHSWILARKFKTLYIRQSYIDLIKIIIDNLKRSEQNHQYHRMAITGNPGIGKSFFLIYVMWKISSMDNVDIHRGKDRGVIYVFKGKNKCWTWRYWSIPSSIKHLVSHRHFGSTSRWSLGGHYACGI